MGKFGHAGPREYFCGSDNWWNLFDLCIVLLALIAILLLTEIPKHTMESMGQVTVLRLVRLTRMVRLVKIFRLRQLKELTLMVKGLFGGLITLVWAVLLLFLFVYILAVIMVTTVGITQIENTSKAFQEEVHPLFKTLDLSMMTVFRCLTGDCSTSTGLPLILLLTGEYGVLFVIFWVATV